MQSKTWIIILGEGRNVHKLVVADADVLIALALENDPLHQKAIRINSLLIEQDVDIIFPVTVFPEAITTLKRAFNQSEKAHALNQRLQAGEFTIEYIDNQTLKLATEYFNKAKSKQNTLFDAIVAATATKLEADAIFSFDEWYPKLGFKLVSEVKN